MGPLPGGWKPLTVQCFCIFIGIMFACVYRPVCVTVSLPHAGTLNAFLKQKGQTTSEGPVWSLSGNQGDRWKQAKVSIHPTASFQVRPKNLINPIHSSIPLVALYFLLRLCLYGEVLVSLGATYWCRTAQALILSREVDGIHRHCLLLRKQYHSRFAIRKPNLCE